MFFYAKLIPSVSWVGRAEKSGSSKLQTLLSSVGSDHVEICSRRTLPETQALLHLGDPVTASTWQLATGARQAAARIWQLTAEKLGSPYALLPHAVKWLK